MSKILKSVTLGDVKNGGIFRALGKEFVKLDADEHGCLVLAKDIWTRMPFRDGDDPECPNDLRRSEIISHKKWHEVQQKVPYSVQHLKYLRNVALAQLGRNLERLPECAALLSRALNTREEQRRADAWAEGDILL